MADFLTQLIDRTQGQLPTVRPQFVPRYASGLAITPQNALGSVFQPGSLAQIPQDISIPERLNSDEDELVETSWRSPLLPQNQPLSALEAPAYRSLASGESLEVMEEFSATSRSAAIQQNPVVPSQLDFQASNLSVPPGLPTPSASLEPHYLDLPPAPSVARSRTGPTFPEPIFPEPLTTSQKQIQTSVASPQQGDRPTFPLVPLSTPPTQPSKSALVQDSFNPKLPAIVDQASLAQASQAIQPDPALQSNAIAPASVPEVISSSQPIRFTEPNSHPLRDRQIKSPLLANSSELRSPQPYAPESVSALPTDIPPITPSRAESEAKPKTKPKTVSSQTQVQPSFSEQRSPQIQVREPQATIQPVVTLTSGLPPLQVPTSPSPIPRSDSLPRPSDPVPRDRQNQLFQSDGFIPPSLPTLEISIGRIVVRAKPAEATTSKSRSQPRGPKVSLNSYLQNRNHPAAGGTP